MEDGENEAVDCGRAPERGEHGEKRGEGERERESGRGRGKLDGKKAGGKVVEEGVERPEVRGEPRVEHVMTQKKAKQK